MTALGSQNDATGDRPILLAANFDEYHLGASLRRSIGRLGVPHVLVDTRIAQRGSRAKRVIAWHLGGHRAPSMRAFERAVVTQCREVQPRALLTTGAIPLSWRTLREIGLMGVVRMNYSTDDPWSPVSGSRWLLRALAEYDVVFTPRRANLDELRALGGPRVEYLPFGYDADIYYPEDLDAKDRDALASDVLFVGGGDSARAALLAPLLNAGIRLQIYGGYWEKMQGFATVARGTTPPRQVRTITCAAKLCLCLVRRSNRDGHVMRTLELAAMGVPILAEDTAEHRYLLGPDGGAVRYFSSGEQLLAIATSLLADDAERARLGAAAFERVRAGNHTYDDRMRAMLAMIPKR